MTLCYKLRLSAVKSLSWSTSPWTPSPLRYTILHEMQDEGLLKLEDVRSSSGSRISKHMIFGPTS